MVVEEIRSHHTKSSDSANNTKVIVNNNDVLEKDLGQCEFKINEPILTKRKKVIKFLFPFYPIKIFKSVYLITFIASLIAMRFVLIYLQIPIAAFGVTISFAWLPVYISGFFLGPIAGLLFGAAADTLGYALGGGGVWFWMYAIQEPIVGLLSGIMGSLYYVIKTHNIKVTMIIQKIIVYSFISFTIFIVVYEYFIIGAKFAKGELKNIGVFAALIISVMLLYLIVNEVQVDLLYKKIKTQKRQEYFVMYCYMSVLVVIITSVFSFMLGPITFVKYIEYTTGVTPSGFLKYGSMFYLIPRVLKESAKTPLYIILLTGIVFAIRKPMANLYNLDMNKW